VNNPKPRYASYTYEHPNFLVRYPHCKRNKLVAEKIIEACSETWLDYGAGDGALLGELLGRDALPRECVLYEPDSFMHSQLANNVNQLGVTASVKLTKEIPEDDSQFGLVTILEVLEHLPLPERIKFYRFLANRLNSGGRVLIEIPIEYGPVLLLKEWGRKFLKKRVSEYSFRELMNASIFSIIFDAHSRYLENDERTFISPHRGFDLNRLILELSSIGRVQEVVRSPFPFWPRMFNQVVLFSFEIEERDASKIADAVIQSGQLGK